MKDEKGMRKGPLFVSGPMEGEERILRPDIPFRVIIPFILFMLFPFVFSCSKKTEVAGPVHGDSITASPSEQQSYFQCGKHHLIRPKVDFLFLWDNSSSSNFINAEMRSALQNTLNMISSRFDYHILLAPLIRPSSGVDPHFLMVEDTAGLNSEAKSLIIPNDDHAKIEVFKGLPLSGGTKEQGFTRVQEIISSNRVNGIFRQKAYTIIVLMSSGDDNGHTSIGVAPVDAELNFNVQKERLGQLAQSLESELFRFISIVPKAKSYTGRSSCPSQGFKEGYFYKKMSEHFYNLTPAKYKTAFENQIKDSYDICTTQFAHIFDGLNQTIQDVVVKHVYQYWPVATSQDPAFDPEKIQVWKNTSSEPLLENDSNGFRYLGYQQNTPTRVLPTLGEPFTGYIIELMGTAKVTFPECVHVRTQAPADYFGYVVFPTEPNLETVEIEINGQKIPQSTTDGWSFLGYFTSKNIKIKGRSDDSEAGPQMNKSGYFLKLHGKAIYTNGDFLKFSYRPAPLK